MHVGWVGGRGAAQVVRVPVPAAAPRVPSPPDAELPAVPPRHPALPSPAPSLARLHELAAAAPAVDRFAPGQHPGTIRNGHYTNTRAQLAFALAGPYNSLEGDVRVRDGRPVMQHDSTGRHDLTFAQWAQLGARAGKHLRIDIKEPAALDEVVTTLRALGVPPGTVTFNVGIPTRWSTGVPVDRIRRLRSELPGAWVTLNLPLPLGPGYLLAAHAARELGSERLGVAVVAGLVHRGDVELLRRSFAVVNAWNIPQLGNVDVPRMTQYLRSIGVNGMIDLRRRDDPLGSP